MIEKNEFEYSDYEIAKAEESVAKNKGNKEILKLITTEAAYEAQEIKDIQNLLLIDYVYNNSQKYNIKEFETILGNETVKAVVENNKISVVYKGMTVDVDINDKLKNTKITKESRDYLAKYYENTMFKYGNMYYLLQKNLGKAKKIKFKDLSTGKKTMLFHENGKPVSSSLRCVTPSTSVEIEFTDKYGKPLYLTLPGIKNVERAIEKLKIGGKYDTAYNDETKKTRIKHALKNDSFIHEVNELITSFKPRNKTITFLIADIDDRYKDAVLYYVDELKNIKFAEKDKKQELIYKKRLHEIAANIKKDSINVIDSMQEVYTIAIDAAKYDPKMKNYFNKEPLLSRYLSEYENVLKDSDNTKKIDGKSNYEKFMQIYYHHLGNNLDYMKDMSSIKKTHERLRDIYRCSIITNYYDNITNIKEKLDGSLRAVFEDDKFFGNSSPHDKGFNKSRGYRDDKVIYEKEDKNSDFSIAFETQFKIAILGEVDLRTHKVYEEIRRLEEELRDCYDTKRVSALKNSISAKKLEIRNIYGDVLTKYNNKVLETAAEMEVELFRKEWKEKLDIPKDLETLKKLNKERAEAEYNLKNGSQTNSEVAKFIKDNLLVSPFKALNIKDDIKNIKDIDYSDKIDAKIGDDVIIILDEVETKADIKSVARRYYNIIKSAYIGVYKGELPEDYFDDYDKALSEKNKQAKNIKSIRGSIYSKSLTKPERAKINLEENEYITFAKKEKVAEKSKKGDNNITFVKKNLDKRGK